MDITSAKEGDELHRVRRRAGTYHEQRQQPPSLSENEEWMIADG